MDARLFFESVGLASMQTLTLTITRNCNLKCEHCWPMCGSDAPSPAVAASVLLRIITQFSHWGVTEICLTGGEPLTHPDWFALVRACCDQPGVIRTRLQTNAILVSSETIDLLASAGLEKLVIEISLEGATAATHDRVRGIGSHRRTLQGIRALVRAGWGSRIVVAFTEMAHNFHELPQLLSLLKDLGVSRLVSGTLVTSGRALDSPAIAMPTPEQYRSLLDRFHCDPIFQSDYRRMGNIACLEWLAGRSADVPAICRCVQMPYITADGILFPCTLLPVQSYGVPGVFSRPLEDVVLQAAVLWRDLPQWYERRRTEMVECRTCSGQGHCGGGCPGRAVMGKGGFSGVEDRCALRKVVYDWRPQGS